MFTCFCLKDQFLYFLCSFQRSLCCVKCKIKKEMNKNPVFCPDDGSLVAVVMVYEVLKTKMHDHVQRGYPDELYVLSKVQFFFFKLDRETETANLYVPSSAVSNPLPPSKHTLSSTSHIVFPTGANLPENSISPL